MKASLAVSLIGLLILFSFIFLLPQKPIYQQKDMLNLLPNQKVMIQGEVIKEIKQKQGEMITLDNSLVLYSSSIFRESIVGKSVLIEGKIEDYFGEKRISILSLKIKND